MDLVDPDAVRGRDTPVLKVNCWGRTWGPLRDARPSGIVLEPAWWCRCRGRWTDRRGRDDFIASDVDATALSALAAAAVRPAPSSTARACPTNRALAVPDAPAVWAWWRARGPRATTTSSASCGNQTSPSPSYCSAPTSRGRGRRLRWPGRCAPPRARPATSRCSCAAVVLAVTSPPSTPSPWRTPSRRSPYLCGPGSGTPVTSRWPTSSPTVRSSHRRPVPRSSSVGWASGGSPCARAGALVGRCAVDALTTAAGRDPTAGVAWAPRPGPAVASLGTARAQSHADHRRMPAAQLELHGCQRRPPGPRASAPAP